MLTICLPQIPLDDVAVIFGIPCACAVVVFILRLLPVTRRLVTGEMTDKQLRAHRAKEDAKFWRVPLAVANEQTIELPERATILSVTIQHDEIRLWVYVNQARAMQNRTIRIYGTGHVIQDDPGKYIGTVDYRGTEFHVFDDGEDRYRGSSVTL